MTEHERSVHEKARQIYSAFIKWYPMTVEDLPSEEWEIIPDWEDYHESSYGRTKSFHNGKSRIIKPSTDKKGYLRVNLCKGGKKKLFQVHRLVALCFIPNPDSKPQINHRDGNKLNNHVSNLEWCTSSENIQHAFDTGLKKSGEDHGQAKLTNEQARYIKENPDGLTQRQLADLFGVKQCTISAIQLGRIWKSMDGVIRQSKCPRVPDEIRTAIRAEYRPRGKGCSTWALAKKYGVNPQTIWRIVHEGGD